MNTINTDVIIIGAGPTGLSLACQFIRYGIDFVVVEKNETFTRFSKAIGVQARTLEIYDQLGLAQPAIEEGEIARRIRLIEGGEVRGEMHLENFGKDLSQFPYMLMLEQSKNEELLYKYLRSQGREVLWKTELESFTQDENGVTAQIKTAGVESQTVTGKYLVGCDGASSPVRHGLGLTFEGSTFERMFYVADARVDWELPHDSLHVCLAREVFTAFFPMKGENRYRIVGTFPESKNEEPDEVLYEEIEQQIKDEAKLSLEISDVRWFSLYKVHSRRVNKFSNGRCFLAGDSAHIHSPTGAQGMNTGIGDAYNLAWKLALVIKGFVAESILDTYNEERLANAQRLLESTDRIFEFAAGSNWLMAFVRTTIFPTVAGYVTSIEPIRKRLFPLISQIGITYRDHSLSQHTDDESDEVQAGDRLPYFVLNGRSIFDQLKEPKFHLLVFSNGEHEALCEQLERELGHVAACQVVPMDARVREVFDKENDFIVFLRPDNHIAFISSEISLDTTRDYLNRIGER
ncbi:MAG TPA: FAD-dependent monooxygenase [Pyrinomonadaceae bacterium]|nr:FAD-dependent monooxygenase [Pyrinomonadaceae bacterium]